MTEESNVPRSPYSPLMRSLPCRRWQKVSSPVRTRNTLCVPQCLSLIHIVGSNFRMIGRQSVRVFGKAGITKFIINRDYVAVIVKAVSYTHLDVYKRQTYCFIT